MINIALLGAGFMGCTHAENYVRIPGVNIVAVAMCSKDGYEKIKGLFPDAKYILDEAALFSDSSVAAFDVCLPTFMHLKYVQKALLTGKPVIVEKPLVLNVQEGKVLLDTLLKSNTQLYVCHVIRFWPEYQYLSKLISEKPYGKITSLDLYRYTNQPTWSSKNWILDQEKSGTPLLDLHIHDVDFTLNCLGEPNNIHTIYNEKHTEVFSQYHYESVLVSIRGGTTYPDSLPFEMGYTAIFEKACLRYSSSIRPSLNLFLNNKKEEIDLQSNTTQSKFGDIPASDGYFNELSHFIDCIKNKKASNIISPVDAVKSIEYIFKQINPSF